MAKRWSEFGSATTIDDADILASVQGGVNKKIPGLDARKSFAERTLLNTKTDNFVVNATETGLLISLDSASQKVVTFPDGIIADGVQGEFVNIGASRWVFDALGASGVISNSNPIIIEPSEHVFWRKIDSTTYLVTIVPDADKSIYFLPDPNGTSSSYRRRSIAGTSTFDFTLMLPAEMKQIISANIYGNVTVGAAQANQDIDIFVNAHQVGQLYNQKSGQNTATTYDLSSSANDTVAISILSALPSPAAKDIIGLEMDHNLLGGAIEYLATEITYR